MTSALGRGTNFPAVAEYNQAVVLDAIRRERAGVSRVELAATTGLSVQTISNVTRRLIQRGLVREGGTRSLGPGKPRTMLELVADSSFAIGVHLDPSVITCVAMDLEGRVIGQQARDVALLEDPEVVIPLIASVVDAVMADTGLDRGQVLGVGVASPGPLDVLSGEVVHPPLLAGWGRVPLRAELIGLTGLPVLVERDVTAAVVAELWTRIDGAVDDFVFFYYGTGVNSGIALGREVRRGVNGRAGSAGHLWTGPGRACPCGRQGCLVQNGMPQEIVNRARAAGIVTHQRTAPPDAANSLRADMEQLVAQARAGDRRAVAVFDALATRLSLVVASLVSVLDVNRVVMGGPFWEIVAEVVQPAFASRLRADSSLANGAELEVLTTRIGPDVAAVGAACLVLDNLLSPRPSSLLLAP